LCQVPFLEDPGSGEKGNIVLAIDITSLHAMGTRCAKTTVNGLERYLYKSGWLVVLLVSARPLPTRTFPPQFSV
jgi:hypothetical protein